MHAQRFYQKYGFAKVADESGGWVPLEILEKGIGYGPLPHVSRNPAYALQGPGA